MEENLPVEIGAVVGGYRLDSVLARGGFSFIYLGSHLQLGRKVALKVLSGELALDNNAVTRFFHEARIVNEIGHPNIVDIIDFLNCESPRCVAYVMELIKGPTLTAALANGPLSVRQAVNIGLQLADAMKAVHAVDVVHRDLKPDNILITGSLDSDLSSRPSIKVLDFGVAKFGGTTKPVNRTVTGVMMGTPHYMAPEQAVSRPVSPATDVYAAGEILYEMVSGRRLFAGDWQDALQLKLGGVIPEVALSANLPGRDRISAIVKGCVSPRASDRPSLGELEAALKEILSELPLEAGSPATPTPSPPLPVPSPPPSFVPVAPRGRQRLWITAVLAGLVLAGALSYGVLGQNGVSAGTSVPRSVPGPVAPVETAMPAAAEATPAAPRSEPEAAPPPAPASAPSAARIAVNTEPAGAELVDSVTKEPLGRAPIEVEVTRAGEPRRLEVQMPGYVSRTVEIAADSPKVLVKLAKLAPLKHGKATVKPSDKSDGPPEKTRDSDSEIVKKDEFPPW